MVFDIKLIFTVLIILIIVLIILAIFILIKLSKKEEELKNLHNTNNSPDSSSIKLLQDQIFNLSGTLEKKIGETGKAIDDKMFKTSELIDKKLSESSKLLGDNMNKTFETSTQINKEANKTIENITKKITQLEETNAQIKDIGGQLKGLENILRNPKQRGNLGEYFLKELLENVFSQGQYKIQYTIKGAGIVDAALFIGDKIIPIDSKFPQENYERLIKAEDEYSIKKYSLELKKDIKNRIVETSKYIMPEENTTDFSFMLIPAEGLYYDIFINKIGGVDAKEIIEYAFSKKVIICSPSSFYAYLQTVMQGMKALQIEDQAKEIQKHVLKLSKDLEKYEEVFFKIGNSLKTTQNHYDSAEKRLQIIDKNIIKIGEVKKLKS